MSESHVFQTEDRHGYSLQFSPFAANLLAVSTYCRLVSLNCHSLFSSLFSLKVCANQNYGIRGGGTVFLLEVSPAGLQLIRRFDCPFALNDLCWSEKQADLILCAAADNSLILFNTTSSSSNPVQIWSAHTNEAYSVSWSHIQPNLFVSGSWDRTAKLFDINSSAPLQSYVGHTDIIYTTIFSPLVPDCFASTSKDSTVRLWDTKQNCPITTIPAHNGEVLTLDWCKYDPNIFATGGTEGLIKLWDRRNLSMEFGCFASHKYAVRRLKFSPFKQSQLISCSYDFTVRVWDYQVFPKRNLELFDHHTEFAYGLDYNLHVKVHTVTVLYASIIRYPVTYVG